MNQLPDNIIVNGDDFGRSIEANNGIVEAFRRKLINRTTLMVNMPYSNEAVELSKRYGFFDKVGLHLNLSEGQPLTSEIKEFPWAYNQSLSPEIFKYLRNNFWLSSKAKTALKNEIDAQMKKYLSYSFTLMHVDSHQHIHNEFLIFPIVKTLAISNGFNAMRISRNMILPTGPVGFLKQIYKSVLNYQIHRSFISTRYFGSYIEFKRAQLNSNYEMIEIMTHPTMINKSLIDIFHSNNYIMDNYKYD